MPRAMRTLLWTLSFCLLVSTPILAQTAFPTPPPVGSSTVTVTLFTGADGSTDDLLFQVSGSFHGDPFPMTFALPGDLAPGATNTYSFLVPHEFCELFQYRMQLAPGGTGDSWTGVVQTVAVNDIPVWTNFEDPFSDPDVTPLNPGGFKGGTWDGTAAYGDRCARREFRMTTVTGPGAADGTANGVNLWLTGPFSASPYRIFIPNTGAFVPGSTVTQRFAVPMRFCDVDGWRLQLSGDPVDTWNVYELYLNFDAIDVFFDTVFYEVGPVRTDAANSGAWTGTQAYQSRCAPGLPGVVTLEPTITGTPVLVNPVLTAVVIPIEPVLVNPIIDPKGATPTPNLPVIEGIVLQPTLGGSAPISVAVTAVPAGQGQPAAVTQAVTCPGFMPSRLVVGGIGRVTPGTPNRLREQASTGAPLLGTIEGGQQFLVLAGPQCDPAGIAWWQVNYNGVIGWTAEGQGATYFTEPVSQ